MYECMIVYFFPAVCSLHDSRYFARLGVCGVGTTSNCRLNVNFNVIMVLLGIVVVKFTVPNARKRG